jgi:hypothetical protein
MAFRFLYPITEVIANTTVCKVIDQSSKQSGEKKGIARESEKGGRGETAGQSPIVRSIGN